MYQVCPSCKKLVEEKAENCLYCGRTFTQKAKVPTLMWCNYCKIKVTPKKPLVGSTGNYNPLMAAIVGDAYQDYYLTIRPLEGNKPDENPKGFICPKCGGKDLTRIPVKKQRSKETPIGILKRRLAQGEITLEEYQQLRKALE